MRLAVFASGTGSNFMAIHEAIKRNELKAEIGFLFCDNPKAKVLERAKETNIPFFCFQPKEFSSKQQFEEAIVDLLNEHHVDLVVLAGYMRLVGPTLLQPFKNRILNIHPSILPAYPGKRSIQEAFEDNIKYSGVTVHYIDEGIDTGPIIAQEKVMLLKEETLASFEERIHKMEHQLYPKVIEQIIQEEGH